MLSDDMASLWAVFLTEKGQEVVADLLIKSVKGEPKASDVVAKAYIEAVKKDSKGSPSLEEKVDKLALICRAAWEIIRDHFGLSDKDLLNKVKEIDLRDGVLDGKVTIAPKTCSKCGKVVSRRHMRCIYCGADALRDTPFDAL